MSILLISSVLIVVAIFMVLVVGLFIWTARKTNESSLLPPTDTQPEWMRTMPPKETVAATLSEGEGIQLFNEDEEEALASPFAEQIEDILRAKLNADPALQQYKVDLGTAPDGGLEISINGVSYAAVSDIPDAKLQALFNEAIEAWGKA